jgi:hypothetical protein
MRARDQRENVGDFFLSDKMGYFCCNVDHFVSSGRSKRQFMEHGF